jgi:hypothetical protein
MKYEIEKEKMSEVLADINELEKLLTERISDMYEVPGMMQARHAYIFYRDRLWGIRDSLKFNIKEVKSGKTSK